MAKRFPGFPAAGMEFLRGLERNNNREWFQEHKAIFETQVKAPMERLVEIINGALAGFAPEHVSDPRRAIYRIYRDTRFSQDKTPYKTHIGATFARRGLDRHGGAGYYFSASPQGVEVAGGIYMPGPAELLAVRNFLAGHHAEVARLACGKALRSLMGDLQGDELKRAPKGFPADHPGLGLLRKKQWYFYVVLPGEIAVTPAIAAEVVKRFRALAPFVDLLNRPLSGEGLRPARELRSHLLLGEPQPPRGERRRPARLQKSRW